MIHRLKITPAMYMAVRDKRKTWELREDDRGFAVGDFLVLEEFDGVSYTGASMVRVVTYILKNAEQFGLPATHCIMSIEPCVSPLLKSTRKLDLDRAAGAAQKLAGTSDPILAGMLIELQRRMMELGV